MQKTKYLVIIDYQHGGTGFYVYARSEEELKQALNAEKRAPYLQIISENVDEHPISDYINKHNFIYDLDNPVGPLETCIRTGREL